MREQFWPRNDNVVADIARAQHDAAYLSPVVRDMYPKAKQAYERFAPNMDQFSGLPGYGTFEADKAYVQDRLAHIEKNDAESEMARVQLQYAKVMEVFLQQYAQTSEWFGEGSVSLSSEYDDFKNQVDLILTLPSQTEGGKPVSIGIDMTFSENKVLAKMRGAVENMKKGKLTEVKYFEDEMTGEKKSLQVPRVILGINREHVTELAGLWKNNFIDKIKNHEVQDIFLREIAWQLDFYKREIETLPTPQPEILQAVIEAQRAIGKVRVAKNEKKPVAKTRFTNERDTIFESIKTGTHH